MRTGIILALCTVLAGCADGPPADQARNGHDLGVLNNAGLALTSQVRTDADNIGDVARRAGAATP